MLALPERFHFGQEWLGVVVFAVIGVLLYRTAVAGRAAAVCKESG